MKKIICTLLTLAILASLSVSVSAAPVLEDLGTPLDEYLVDYPNMISARNIYDMTVYDGKLYIGWGDYGDNIGTKLNGLPLVRYFDATNSWKMETLLDDEEIARFFQYNDKLYITGTDPIKRVGSIYVRDKEGIWTILSTFDDGIHVYDMLVNDGTVYVNYGQSGGRQSVIRYSTDFVNFNDIPFLYDGENTSLNGGAFGRSYNLFEFNGDVYATLKMSGANDTYNGIYKLDKNKMVLNYVGKGQNQVLVTGTPATFDAEFAGKYICARGTMIYTDNPADDNSWQTFTGVEGNVSCIKVIDDTLYLMAYTEKDGTFTNTLYKTNDLEKMDVVYSFDYTACVQSFCQDNGVFYFGTGYTKNVSKDSVGRIFSLKPDQPQKTDIVIKTDIADDEEDKIPKWVRFKLKVGGVLVEDAMLNDTCKWEYTLKDVDVRDDWTVEVASDSYGHEWRVKHKDGTFILTNKPQEISQTGILIIALAAGLLLIGGAVVVVLIRKRKKQQS